MKFLFVLIVAIAAASARPQYSSAPHQRFDGSREVIEILKDDRVQPENGSYSFDIETADGISRSEAGQNDNDAGAVVQAGQMSYYLPDGTLFELKFVADENGYQPQSDFLPVAPAFPHPIPEFVLEQIERAEREHAAARAAGRDEYKIYN